MSDRHGMQALPRSSDAGLTLIEVMVALLIFAILSTGIVAAMGTIARMTSDTRSRVTAANLATREIDQVRALADPFKVVAATTAEQRAGYDYTVDGRTFTIKRTLSWVSESGGDVSCNSATNLFYLRINVRVTWSGMLQTTAPVQDDTVLAPTARLSDSSTGAIGVSILGAAGEPQAGIGVAVTKNTGGKDLAKPPAATDNEGCTYASQVYPGNYDVVASKSGWITSDQLPNSTVSPVAVTAGTTASPTFPLYAKAATVKPTFTTGPVKYSATTVYVPTNIDTSWLIPDGTIWTTAGAAPAAGIPRFPYGSGYDLFTGLAKSTSGTPLLCPSVDPKAWSQGTSNGKALGQGERLHIDTAAGATVTNAAVPMGVVLVKTTAGRSLWATPAVPTGAGNPGCAVTGTKYVFPMTTTTAGVAIALPYGSWRITSSGSTTVPVPATDLSVMTNADGKGVASDGTVTLDPRGLQ